MEEQKKTTGLYLAPKVKYLLGSWKALWDIYNYDDDYSR